MPLHNSASGVNLHEPQGTSGSGVTLDLVANTANAFQVTDALSGRDILLIDTTTADPGITLGNDTDTYDLHLLGHVFVGSPTQARDLTIYASDNDANAVRIIGGDSTVYFTLDTTNNAARLFFGADDIAENTRFIFRGEGAVRLTSLTTTERDAVISPEGGMVVWNETNTDLEYYNGSAWSSLTSGGGGSNTLDQAYDQGGAGSGRSITVDSGAVELVRDSASDASYAIDVSYSAVAFTGTPHGFLVDWSGATSLSNAGNVYGLRLVGETNAGAGDSVAVSIDGGWDQGIENASSYSQLAGDFDVIVGSGLSAEFHIANSRSTAFRVQEGSNDYIVVNTVTNQMDLGNVTNNPPFNFLGTGLITAGGNVSAQGTLLYVNSDAGTGDEDSELRLGGGDGTNESRARIHIDSSASALMFDFEDDNAGDESFNGVTSFYRFNYSGGSVASRNTDLVLYSSTGAALRTHRIRAVNNDIIITPNSTGSDIRITQGNFDFDGANIDLDPSGNFDLTLTGSSTFDITIGSTGDLTIDDGTNVFLQIDPDGGPSTNGYVAFSRGLVDIGQPSTAGAFPLAIEINNSGSAAMARLENSSTSGDTTISLLGPSSGLSTWAVGVRASAPTFGQASASSCFFIADDTNLGSDPDLRWGISRLDGGGVWYGEPHRLSNNELLGCAQDFAQTDGTGTVEIWSMTVPDGDVFTVVADILGYENGAGGDAASYLMRATFKRNGGTVSQVGSTTLIDSHEDSVGWNNPTISVSGTSARVAAEGTSGVTIEWSARIWVTMHSSTAGSH